MREGETATATGHRGGDGTAGAGPAAVALALQRLSADPVGWVAGWVAVLLRS